MDTHAVEGDSFSYRDLGIDCCSPARWNRCDHEGLQRMTTPNARGAVPSTPVEAFGVRFDPQTLMFYVQGEGVALTLKPMRILHMLLSASPRVVSRHAIEEAIWGHDPPDSDALRVHISDIRSRLSVAGRSLLRTKHGHGYYFSDHVVSSSVLATSREGAPGS